MSCFRRLALAICAAAPMAGCVSTDDHIPLVDASPNPAPVRGYKVLCNTHQVGFPFYIAMTGCTQVIPPSPEPRAVIRAAG